MTRPSETCQVITGEAWSRHPCGRPVKRNGMCGIHAAAAERRAASDRRWRERFDRMKAEDQERKRAEGIAANLAMLLTDRLGVPFTSRQDVRLSNEAATQLLNDLGVNVS